MKNTEHLAYRIVYAAIFATAFMVISNQATDFYFKNIDKTEYFKVAQPVTIDKNEVLPCDKITVHLVRTSAITARAVSTVELILVNDNGEWFKQTVGGGDFNIDKSENQVIKLNFVIPCGIPTGKYHLKTVVEYAVRGIPKTCVWQSEEFKVMAL